MIGRMLMLAVAVAMLPACAGEGGGERLANVSGPECSTQGAKIVLLAQTVQDATHLPCITGLPAGWSYGGEDFGSGSGLYRLSSAIAGKDVVQVRLLSSCERTGEPFTVEGTTGISGYLSTDAGGETRRFVFEGGCVEERIDLPTGSDDLLVEQARGTLGFLDRAALAAELKRVYGITLCGAGADPCEG